MQNFRDSITEQDWAFDDDVVVTDTDGVYSFGTAEGVAITTPATLQPYTGAPATPPAPTPAQQAQLLLKSGLTVISSTIPFPATTPGVTFNTDPGSILKYASVQMRLAATGVFPGSVTTWTLKDTLGTEHILTGPQYTVLTSAISDFVSACDRVIDGYTDATLPQNVIDLDPPPAPPTP